MRNSITKHGKTIAIIVILCVGIALITTAVFMLVSYRQDIYERSSSRAQYYTLKARNDTEDKLNDKTIKAVAVANALSDLGLENDIRGYLKALKAKIEYDDVKVCRYYKGDDLYTDNGVVYSTEDSSRAYRAEHKNEAGYTGMFTDAESEMMLIGFYAPINNPKIEGLDAVVIYYTRETLENALLNQKKSEESEFTVVCTKDGKVLGGKEQITTNQIYDELRERIGDKTPVDQVERIISEGSDGTVAVKIGGVDHLISIGANKIKTRDIAVVELYRIDVLYASSFQFIQTIIAIIIIFAVIFIAVIVYYIFNSAQMRRQLYNKETTDHQLDCFNRHGFEKEVKRILDRNLNAYFAVIVVNLRHYKYLLENFGESETNSLLTFIRLTCSKAIQIEETYGRIEEGQFLMLMHAKDRQGLLQRLKVHSALVSQYKGAHKFDILLRYGIYEVKEGEKTSVSKMIDYANEANNTVVHATKENAGMQFNFYSDDLRKIRQLNEDMELRMEGALQNGEFEIFYQPKYNLNTKRQDGCEALVRWYDPQTKKYNVPALFMKLFETNGFIVKLDKYVYTKVCEYISYSIAHGRTVYPVSVNISRVTAIQTDFVEFYTRIKRKYGIADGQIMIEFTESFAYENYEMLETIVDKLHKGGFKCSIDDFGCGYSSYRILKSLPMDEIKLDKFFVEKSSSPERDKHIFESIISLAKKLGMKVTQEGVEQKEELDLLISLGCDVVQGYYYAKPMPLADYISFCSNSREHNIT